MARERHNSVHGVEIKLLMLKNKAVERKKIVVVFEHFIILLYNTVLYILIIIILLGLTYLHASFTHNIIIW